MSLEVNCIQSNRLIISGGTPAVDKVLVCKSAAGVCEWDAVPGGGAGVEITERSGQTAASRDGMWTSDGVNQSETIYNFDGQQVMVYGLIDVEIDAASGLTGDFIMTAPVAPTGNFTAGTVSGTGSLSGAPSFSVSILPAVGTQNIRFAGGALAGSSTLAPTTMTYTYSYTLSP